MTSYHAVRLQFSSLCPFVFSRKETGVGSYRIHGRHWNYLVWGQVWAKIAENLLKCCACRVRTQCLHPWDCVCTNWKYRRDAGWGQHSLASAANRRIQLLSTMPKLSGLCQNPGALIQPACWEWFWHLLQPALSRREQSGLSQNPEVC